MCGDNALGGSSVCEGIILPCIHYSDDQLRHGARPMNDQIHAVQPPACIYLAVDIVTIYDIYLIMALPLFDQFLLLYHRPPFAWDAYYLPLPHWNRP